MRFDIVLSGDVIIRPSSNVETWYFVSCWDRDVDIDYDLGYSFESDFLPLIVLRP